MPVDNLDKRYDVLTYRCIVREQNVLTLCIKTKPACVRETSLFTHSVYRKLDRGCRICQTDRRKVWKPLNLYVSYCSKKINKQCLTDPVTYNSSELFQELNKFCSMLEDEYRGEKQDHAVKAGPAPQRSHNIVKFSTDLIQKKLGVKVLVFRLPQNVFCTKQTSDLCDQKWI